MKKARVLLLNIPAIDKWSASNNTSVHTRDKRFYFSA